MSRRKKENANEPASLGLLYGINKIAGFCSLSKNQARRLVRTRVLPAFVIHGDVVCARKRAIIARIEELEAASPWRGRQ